MRIKLFYLCIIGVNEIIFMCYKYLYYVVYKKNSNVVDNVNNVRV